MATPSVPYSVGVSTGGSLGLTPQDIAALASVSVTGLYKALSSGVEEYAIGDRSLKRHQLEQYLKVLAFTSNAAAAVSPDGSTSAIQSRRGIPCDV
jgi:hypothetical protein